MTSAVASSSPSSRLSTPRYSHAVSRSAELLSCAKTALKIAKRQQNGESSNNEWYTNLQVSDLRLDNGDFQSNPKLEDGLNTLKTMRESLKDLEGVVRRRGHTNDPTEEIRIAISELEQDATALSTLIQTMVPAKTFGQRERHWKCIQQWFQQCASANSEKLKKILEVRGIVLAEQTKRRQRFQVPQKNTTNASALFSLPPPPPPKPKVPAPESASVVPTPSPSISPPQQLSTQQQRPAPSVNGTSPTTTRPIVANDNTPNGTTTRTATAPTNPYASYYNTNSSYGGGYGGGDSSGMRQRRAATGSNFLDDSQQLELRQMERQNAQRLNEARHAEKSLAELGTVFGKMSTLISQQSELIEHIEDDVEAAHTDVLAGQHEITILYSIRKGNRPLILKTFGLLIFLIVFLRLYAK